MEVLYVLVGMVALICIGLIFVAIMLAILAWG